MNAKTTAQMKQDYEARFGIQGHRMDNLSPDELVRALKTNTPNWKAPARGSATRKVQITPADMIK